MITIDQSLHTQLHINHNKNKHTLNPVFYGLDFKSRSG